jgi:hypothetical protein
MNKIKFISLTASLVLATTFTLSCEDKEDKPAPAAVTANTAVTATPNETATAAKSKALERRPAFRLGRSVLRRLVGKTD